MRKNYSVSDDPREITVKWPGKCAETGKNLNKGDKAIYYPKSKKMYAADSKTADDYRSWKFDCSCLGTNY